jgi:hypothetical protein
MIVKTFRSHRSRQQPPGSQGHVVPLRTAIGKGRDLIPGASDDLGWRAITARAQRVFKFLLSPQFIAGALSCFITQMHSNTASTCSHKSRLNSVVAISSQVKNPLSRPLSLKYFPISFDRSRQKSSCMIVNERFGKRSLSYTAKIIGPIQPG